MMHLLRSKSAGTKVFMDLNYRSRVTIKSWTHTPVWQNPIGEVVTDA